MKINRNQQGLLGSLPGLLLGILLCVSVTLFAASFNAAPENSPPNTPLNASAVPSACPTPALGNYPDASVALSANTTVIPDAPPIPPTIDGITASTSTNFKGTMEGYRTTGIVRVTNPHPAGTYTVTVQEFFSAYPLATKTFTLTVATPLTCVPVNFGETTPFGGVVFSMAVAVGDFNGDGKQDLAVADYGAGQPHPREGSMWILLGNGAGDFTATSFDASFSFRPTSVAVGDFNDDGNQDVVAATNYNNVSILLGDGTGNVSSPISLAPGTNTSAVAVGDFNGDRKQDIVTNNSILLGDGSGGFSNPANPGASGRPAVGDFNGDGKQDLAFANSDGVSILLGDGTGNFGAPTTFPAAGNPSFVAIADFNGDNKQDLAVSNRDSQNVSILLGDGTGNFNGPTNFAAGNAPTSVAVGDFDGDSKQDLAVTDFNGGTPALALLLGDGAGNFSSPIYLSVGNFSSVAVGDFNGDSKQDLAVGNAVLLRTCAPTPTPTATPFTARLGNISTRVRVETGENVMIGGLIINGAGSLQVVIRGIGPSLGQLGIPDFLPDPILEVRDSTGALLLQNDNWQDDEPQAKQLTKLGLAPTQPAESALIIALPSGAYTAIVTGKNGGTGISLVEVYNVDHSVPVGNIDLANISTRGLVQTGNNVMIGGFILLGASNENALVAVRGIGPSLTQFGITNALADPTLELHDGNGAVLVANDNWQDDPAAAGQLTAHGLAPSDPNESGIFMSLHPGLYTAILAGTDGGTGVGLVEIYNLQ